MSVKKKKQKPAADKTDKPALPAKKVKPDTFPYAKCMLVGAFAQLVLAAILYIVFAISPTVLAILGILTVAGLILAAKVEHKAARVSVRIVFYGIPVLAFLASLVTLIAFLVQNDLSSSSTVSLALRYSAMTLVLLFETTLLCAIPVLAVQSHVQRRRCDIFMLRLFSILQLALALLTVLYVIDANMLTLGIDNGYFNVFFCLVCAVTALCSLAAFPIRTRWLSRLFVGNNEAAAELEEAEQLENAEEAQSEEENKVDWSKEKPIFRDRGE